MLCIAGIDEAGYGPTLGPLVVSLVAFQSPNDFASEPSLATGLWRALAPVVGRSACQRDEDRVSVDDSKALYHSGSGLGRLEEGVLAFVEATCGCFPGSLDDLLGLIGLEAPDTFDRLPWYRDRSIRLPREAGRERIGRLAARVAARLGRLGLRLRIVTHPVHEARLNEQIRASGNKASALFEEIMHLLSTLRKRAVIARRAELDLCVDRLGGRRYYGDLLREAFPASEVAAVCEGKGRSDYRIHGLFERISIRFREKADRRELPVALASMVSKYVRELLMAAFNRFWTQGSPSLRPTAGYPVDARRFLREIRDRAGMLGIRDEELIRVR